MLPRIREQIDCLGVAHTVKWYSTMLEEVEKMVRELEDRKRASVFSDVSEVLKMIIAEIGNQ